MKKNSSIEIKIYKTIFVVLLIALVVVVGLLIYKYGANQINEKQSHKNWNYCQFIAAPVLLCFAHCFISGQFVCTRICAF